MNAEVLTPPVSPESSRLVTKRRCPFGESPQQYKIAATTETKNMYSSLNEARLKQGKKDYTLQLLMNSQKERQRTCDHYQYLQSPLCTATSFEKCWVCQKSSETMPCAFCEHNACEMCVRQCIKCLGVFCGFCSTINYDCHDDRSLCLTCNAEELKRSRAVKVSSSTNRQQNPCFLGLPQVMA